MITLKTNLKIILVALLVLAALLSIKIEQVEESIADPLSVSDDSTESVANNW